VSYFILEKNERVEFLDIVRDSSELIIPPNAKLGCDVGVLEKTILDHEKRVIDIVTSSDRKDRDGDRIIQDGIDHSQHMKTKSVLFAHDYGRTWLPIAQFLGARLAVRTEGSTIYNVTVERHQFNPPGAYPVSDAAWKLAAFGSLHATSIGFMPIRWVRPGSEEERVEMDLGPWGVLFEKIEKFETSWVPVPANRDAIREAFGAGVISRSEARVLFPTSWHEVNKPRCWSGVNFDEAKIDTRMGTVDAHMDTLVGDLESELTSLRQLTAQTTKARQLLTACAKTKNAALTRKAEEYLLAACEVIEKKSEELMRNVRLLLPVISQVEEVRRSLQSMRRK
jgi:hypothetical protein